MKQLATMTQMSQDNTTLVLDRVDEGGGQLLSVYSPIRAFHGNFEDW